jgi:nicotinate-nucleotide pyrophosphorylase (carboxylating)
MNTYSAINNIFFKEHVNLAIKEDFGILGDVTSSIIPDNSISKFEIVAKEDCVICGVEIAKYIFDNLSFIATNYLYKDSDFVKSGSVIMKGEGSSKEILTLERVCLNYMQHLSGISTITKKFVDEVGGTNARVCDTRKTTPGLRALQKYAVRCGGGNNHRAALDSSILIKDNHISILGSVSTAINEAKKMSNHYSKIIVECDTKNQVIEAIECGVDIIMLDNMGIELITECVRFINKRSIVEASGSVNINNIKEIANTGVDYISVGRITHSAPAIDISLNII